jgi:hypothetical protein
MTTLAPARSAALDVAECDDLIAPRRFIPLRRLPGGHEQ